MTTANHTIHWLGAGLSSIPGIKHLANGSHKLIVWNRTLAKAEELLSDISAKVDIQTLDWHELKARVKAGDVVVSMLPATMHLEVAQLCLEQNAHFVSSSYIAPQMAELDAQAKAQNLCFVNEVGLDPGIDHLLAHALVANYQQSAQFDPSHGHYFRSYCGGFPKQANDFKYKFSWSPLGVLKALRSPAQWVANGQQCQSTAPWDALSEYHAKFSAEQDSEMFQAYPNRDSVPFMSQYHFGRDWNVQEFVRGTLRLAGWSDAWQSIFDEVATLEGEAGDKRLAQISQQLEHKYSYAQGEADRVVLCVELQVNQDDKPVWHQSYQLDAYGNENGHAMGRLVSLTVSIAVNAVLAGDIDTGVSAAPHQPNKVHSWLDQLAQLGETVNHINHLA